MVLRDRRVHLDRPVYRDLVDSRVLLVLPANVALEASMVLLGCLALTVKMVVMEATESTGLTALTVSMAQTAMTALLGKTVRMESEVLKVLPDPKDLKARKDLKDPSVQLGPRDPEALLVSPRSAAKVQFSQISRLPTTPPRRR